MKKGFTLIELLIVVAIIAILAAIAVPNFLEAQTRSKVARVRADHRSMATGIETYFLDNNQYPAFHADTGGGPTNAVIVDAGLPNYTSVNTRSFAIDDNNDADRLNSITTPISYLSSYPADPFADTRGLSFRYYSTPQGFIVGSYGPDADEGSTAGDGDLGWGDSAGNYNTQTGGIETVYDPTNTLDGDPNVDFRTTLIVGDVATGNAAHTYDSTNGTISPGDVWRIRD